MFPTQRQSPWEIKKGKTMGIDARIEDENGQCIEELGDPKELVAVLLPRYDDNTWGNSGDTILNCELTCKFISINLRPWQESLVL